ncbi:hypothetical protein ABIC63_005620 [Pseudacidovorax sp. 1753]|uniref:hypothetical protein n=1 Tax=Pseudacidovorax sp. 1753 TaxID=3156419 RepID=UPI00339596EA
MRIDATITGIDKVRHLADKLTGPQMRAVQAAAINDTAFKVRGVMVSALTSAFDRPTPFIARSPKVVQATPENLTARIIPTLDSRGTWSPGGKIGVDPQHVLQAQEFGGRRADKRSEVALRRAGILPVGMQTAIPRTPYPGSDDGRGNLRGAFLSQLISYLQASGEQGYRANMTDRRKAQLRNQQGIGSVAARRVYMTTLGVRYFVAYGRLRGGRTRHLAPGVWAARGTHDADLVPVLLFVRTPGYAPRISMDDIAAEAQASEVLARRMRYRIRQAAGV